MRIGILYSAWRRDEELLERAAAKRGHEVVGLGEDALRLPLAPLVAADGLDIVLERCQEHARALASLTHYHALSVPTVNTLEVARVCGNKVYTTGALARAQVPTPATQIAYSVEGALEACEALGFPVILKPVVGDMGRLVARVDGRDQARAVLEHKRALAQPQGPVFYVQRFLDKPGRDIRALVVGEEVVGAVYIISNRAVSTEDEGILAPCELSPELVRTVAAAAAAVGGGVLGVDLIEGPDGLAVTEVNYTIEFARLEGMLRADVPGRVIEHLERVARS